MHVSDFSYLINFLSDFSLSRKIVFIGMANHLFTHSVFGTSTKTIFRLITWVIISTKDGIIKIIDKPESSVWKHRSKVESIPYTSL